MIVVDASVVVEVVLGLPRASVAAARLAGDPSQHAPGLLDLEVTQVVRRHCAEGRVSPHRGAEAIADLIDLRIRRYPHTPLLRRIWALRDNVTAYDAAYVALAESLDAPLLTFDRRLAAGTWHRASVELL